MKTKMAHLDRAKLKNYVKYMLTYPYHFEMLSGQVATVENIGKFFKKVRKK